MADSLSDSEPPYGAIALRMAYNVNKPVPRGGGRTIAIVGAFAHPTPDQSVNAYRANYGLPTTTIAQYNQDGGPLMNVSYNPNWGLGQMKALEMVSAMCPLCPLIYVGAKNNTYADLAAGVRFAQTVADVVAIGWGLPEDASSPVA